VNGDNVSLQSQAPVSFTCGARGWHPACLTTTPYPRLRHAHVTTLRLAVKQRNRHNVSTIRAGDTGPQPLTFTLIMCKNQRKLLRPCHCFHDAIACLLSHCCTSLTEFSTLAYFFCIKCRVQTVLAMHHAKRIRSSCPFASLISS